MNDSKLDPKFIELVTHKLEEKGCILPLSEVSTMVDLVKEEVVSEYVTRLVSHVENILEINPSLEEKEILEEVAKNIVLFLGAGAASIRIYDPGRSEMISFGSFPKLMKEREEAIPFEDTIAGEVVRTHQPYLVPNILKEEKYKNKEKMLQLGIHSMLAIPISIPRFSLKDVDIEGSFQIYYEEKDKAFTIMETKIAELFARRVSYVVARKRIMSLQKLNVTKDKVVEQIFLKLGKREGVKMKEVFNLVIPELVDIMRIQRCSLFSVGEDRKHVVLEAGYPEEQHGIGKIFWVMNEPYLDAVVNQVGPFGEFENEKMFPSYILIHNPQESSLLPPDLKGFLEIRQIHSVLYIPLKVNEDVNYFLAFDAQAHHRRFTDEEIEIFIFFGKELMKGLRLEKMDDILHDFKNPAIAVAGFAKRIQKIMEQGEVLSKKEKVVQAVDIILKEASRIQELALTLHGEGREELVDLTEKVKKRFLINQEAMKELKRGNVNFIEGDLESPLWIRCYPLHIERVLDNLLNNASNAMPEEGGQLFIRSYQKDSWGTAEVTNTGEIQESDRDRYLLGEGRGRGLHITTRLVKQMKGKMEMESGEGRTTFRVMFPLVR